MRLVLLILVVLLVNPVFGQRNRDEEIVIPTYTEGVTYALPRTGVKIYVKAVKEEFQPGPYAVYAEQLLGISEVRTNASVEWMIEDVSMTTFSEPDPGQVYKAMGNAAYRIALTPTGCLTGINSTAESSVLLQLETNRFIEQPEIEDGFSFEYINDSPLYTPGDSTNNFRPVRIGADVKAAEAARRILESRRMQYEMVAGMMDAFHPDGKAYEVSLAELEEIEDEYLSLFVGRTTYKEQLFSFDYIPTQASRNGEVVFRFSEDSGVVPSTDLAGRPVTVRVEPVETLNQQYASNVGSENPNAGESGVYYRMPGMANLELIYELNTIASMRALVAQFGVVAPLPEDLLTGEYAVDIHPETGAIKSVSAVDSIPGN